LINAITTTDEKERRKGLKKYEKAVEKYENIAPINQRMEQTVQKANEGRIGATKKRLQKTLAKDGKAFEVKYMLFTRERRELSKRKVLQIVIVHSVSLLIRTKLRTKSLHSHYCNKVSTRKCRQGVIPLCCPSSCRSHSQ